MIYTQDDKHIVFPLSLMRFSVSESLLEPAAWMLKRRASVWKYTWQTCHWKKIQHMVCSINCWEFSRTVILHCQLMRDRSKGLQGQSSGDQKADGRSYDLGNLKWMKNTLQENTHQEVSNYTYFCDPQKPGIPVRLQLCACQLWSFK